MNESIVYTDRLTKSFTQGRRRIIPVQDLFFEMRPGEFVALMGRSGSGKSTLLAVLSGLERPDAGTVTVAGIDIHSLNRAKAAVFRRRHVGFLFQTVDLLPTLTALENVMLPAILDGVPSASCRARSEALLHAVSMAHLSDSLPDQLSGGERQRVGIARAMVNKPVLILADEPTGSLDHEAGQVVVALLRQAAQEAQSAVLLATHDADVAAAADRVLMIRHGRLREAPHDSTPYEPHSTPVAVPAPQPFVPNLEKRP